MARIRTLKPEYYSDVNIAQLEFVTRIAYQGLWNYSDKDGKFEWDPIYLKSKIFPGDLSKINRKVNMEEQLSILEQPKRNGKPYIIKYTGPDGKTYGQVLTFVKHQKPHPHEPASEIPSPTDEDLKKANHCNTQANHCNTQQSFKGVSGYSGYSGMGDTRVRASPLALFELWNKYAEKSNLPKCVELSDSRISKCRLRLNERPLDEWEKLFSRMARTPFLNGDSKQQWRASFDWIISNKTNAAKVLEGTYESGRPSRGLGAPELPQAPSIESTRQERDQGDAEFARKLTAARASPGFPVILAAAQEQLAKTKITPKDPKLWLDAEIVRLYEEQN